MTEIEMAKELDANKESADSFIFLLPTHFSAVLFRGSRRAGQECSLDTKASRNINR
jgi:hypothetical protein